MMRSLVLCAFAALALTPACFGFSLFPPGARGGDDDDDDDDDDDGDSFELLIDTAELRSRIDDFEPGLGEVFVLFGLTFNNPVGRDPVSTSPALLSLANEGGLIVTNASSFSSENACESDVSVAGGGSVSCSIAFANDADAVPVQLLYDDGAGVVADVDIVTVTPLPELQCLFFGTPPGIDSACFYDCANAICQAEINDAFAGCSVCVDECGFEPSSCECALSCEAACVETLAAFDACAAPCLDQC